MSTHEYLQHEKYCNITRYDLRVPTYEYSIYKTRHYFTWSYTRNSFVSFANQEINELELLDSIDGELLRASRLFVDSSVRTDNSLSHPSHLRLVYRYSTIVLVVRSQQKREMERSSAAGPIFSSAAQNGRIGRESWAAEAEAAAADGGAGAEGCVGAPRGEEASVGSVQLLPQDAAAAVLLPNAPYARRQRRRGVPRAAPRAVRAVRREWRLRAHHHLLPVQPERRVCPPTRRLRHLHSRRSECALRPPLSLSNHFLTNSNLNSQSPHGTRFYLICTHVSTLICFSNHASTHLNTAYLVLPRTPQLSLQYLFALSILQIEYCMQLQTCNIKLKLRASSMLSESPFVYVSPELWSFIYSNFVYTQIPKISRNYCIYKYTTVVSRSVCMLILNLYQICS